MKVADYIVDFLIGKGVTDAFGIPGGVVLDILYAMDKRAGHISAHLSYHEQGAAFAACGYAQATGKPGVAYATRGPGIANMVTAIADAYYDSIPVLLITAHGARRKHASMRVEADQDMDPIPMVSHIVKYAVRVECAEEVTREIEYAYRMAVTGRRGPVVLDFSARILSEELPDTALQQQPPLPGHIQGSPEEIGGCLAAALKNAKRPVMLIGNGIKQSNTAPYIREIVEKARIPVLSSLISQDAIAGSPMYFGYIGSHGTRYSNFILSKADLMLAFGNRMSFPVNSASFGPVVQQMKTIRIDTDEAEFLREVPNSITFAADLEELLPKLASSDLSYTGSAEWIAVCRELRDSLKECDTDYPVKVIAEILQALDEKTPVVSDVGNNAFWLARAYAYAGAANRLLSSKSFSALGCALPKAVGAYFSTGNPVVCVTGDQGFQLNIQELQMIAHDNIPVLIVLLNNHSSGMIRMREKQQYGSHLIHTTFRSGYSNPDFKAVTTAYGLHYDCCQADGVGKVIEEWKQKKRPGVLELLIDEGIDLEPVLPIGKPCQDLAPALLRELYESLNRL